MKEKTNLEKLKEKENAFHLWENAKTKLNPIDYLFEQYAEAILKDMKNLEEKWAGQDPMTLYLNTKELIKKGLK